MYLWLSWTLLCRPGQPQNSQDPLACASRALGLKAVVIRLTMANTKCLVIHSVSLSTRKPKAQSKLNLEDGRRNNWGIAPSHQLPPVAKPIGPEVSQNPLAQGSQNVLLLEGSAQTHPSLKLYYKEVRREGEGGNPNREYPKTPILPSPIRDVGLQGTQVAPFYKLPRTPQVAQGPGPQLQATDKNSGCVLALVEETPGVAWLKPLSTQVMYPVLSRLYF